jgi:hypothetical protein
MDAVNTGKAIAKVTAALLSSEARSATLYLTETLSVRVSRRMFTRRRRGKVVSRRFGRFLDLVVTVGKPNHAGREFVKRAKVAREPFPIKKVHLSFPAAR